MNTENLSQEDAKIVQEETDCLERVVETIELKRRERQVLDRTDDELVELRDQLGETRAEDHAMLVEHMTRIAALRKTKQTQEAVEFNHNNPYFGRLELQDQFEGKQRIREILIGKQSLIDPKSGLQIVDWRNSPISRIFYCYEVGDEYEELFGGQEQTGLVNVRRTLKIDAARLTTIRDVDTYLGQDAQGVWHRLADARTRLAGGAGTAVRVPDRTLQGRNDEHKLPEITALIDPEQFKAMTEVSSGVMVLSGGAGTGKTTIALHRVAYLHFQNPAFFSAKRTLILTPGDALRRYVSNVLPSLGMKGVRVRTFADWGLHSVKQLVPSLKKWKLTQDTPLGARRLKRHHVMVSLLEKVVNSEAAELDEEIEGIGGKGCLQAWVSRRNLAIFPRGNAFIRWLGQQHQLSPDVKDSLTRVVKRAVDELCDPFETWAAMLTDESLLKQHFSNHGVDYYQWELTQLIKSISTQMEAPGEASQYGEHGAGIDGRSIFEGELRGHLDEDDIAILLRLCQLKFGTTTGPSGRRIKYHHIMVDEAQDLSPITVQMLCHCAEPKAPVTLSGDTAQRLSLDSGFGDWKQLVEVTKIRARILPPLAVSYRSTTQIMTLAREILGPLAQQLDAKDARDGASVEHLTFDGPGEAVLFLADALNSLRDRERSATIALVARDVDTANLYYAGLKRAEVPALRRITAQEFSFTPGIDVTDIYQIKGLEYDYVIGLEISERHYPKDDEARHLLHILATRAAHQLWLISTETPSPIVPEKYRHATP